MIYNFDEQIDRSKSNCMKYDKRAEVFKREDVLPLWIADMDFATPDFILSAVRKRLEHKVFGYPSIPKGFYHSIIHWLKKRHNWQVKKEWILCCSGVVPSLSISVLAYTNEGDGVIIQPPVYYPFFSLVKKNNRQLLLNELVLKEGKYIMDLEDLEVKAKKSKMMILCNPHNPGGRVWTKEELKQVADICIRNNVVMVSDEIHSDLVFSPHRYTPLCSLSEEISFHTITCTSPSKTFNLAGFSTSSTIIPNGKLQTKFQQTTEALHSELYNVFSYLTSQIAYERGEEWLEELLVYLSINLYLLLKYFDKHMKKVKVIKPEASYLVWLDFRELGLSASELHDLIVHKAGLGLSQGHIFGTAGRGFYRINIACPRKILEIALEKLKTSINSLDVLY